MAPRDPGLGRDVLEAQAFFLARGAQALADCRNVRLDQFSSSIALAFRILSCSKFTV